MSSSKTTDYTGHSQASMNEAMLDALEKAAGHPHLEVIETRSSKLGQDQHHYQVTLKTVQPTSGQQEVLIRSHAQAAFIHPNDFAEIGPTGTFSPSGEGNKEEQYIGAEHHV